MSAERILNVRRADDMTQLEAVALTTNMTQRDISRRLCQIFVNGMTVDTTGFVSAAMLLTTSALMGRNPLFGDNEEPHRELTN